MLLYSIFLSICVMESLELPLNIEEMDTLLHQLDSMVHSLKREKRQDAQQPAVATDAAPPTGPGTSEGQPEVSTGAPGEQPGFAMSVPGMTMVSGCPSFTPQFPGGMNIPGLPAGMNIPGLPAGMKIPGFPGGFGGGMFQISVPKHGFGMNMQGFGGSPGAAMPGQGTAPGAASPPATAKRLI